MTEEDFIPMARTFVAQFWDRETLNGSSIFVDIEDIKMVFYRQSPDIVFMEFIKQPWEGFLFHVSVDKKTLCMKLEVFEKKQSFESNFA